jgi:hypothetical protein
LPQEAPPQGRSARRVDALIVAALLGGWLVGLAGPALRSRPIGHDTYRDAAYAEHLQQGRWSDDPALVGYSYWYAPLGPLLYSYVSRIAAASALAVYGTAVLWVNIWILPALYLLVRRSFDRFTALTAVIFVCLGSRWWSSNLSLPIPAVQGLVPMLITLWAWVAIQPRKIVWAVPVGLLLALCTWHHVICGIVTSVAIVLHALIDPTQAPRPERRLSMLRVGVLAAVCGVLVAPLAIHLATLPRRNLVPPTWISGEMFDPAYAAHSATPLILPLALAGVALVWRNARPHGGWLLGLLLIGLAGQLPVYLNRYLGWSLPVLLPHEFQWHGQLAVAILAAVSAVRLARAAAGPARGISGDPAVGARSSTAAGWAWACLVALAVGPDVTDALRRFDDRWISSRTAPAEARAAEWIKSHTGVYDVFLCRPQTGYRVVGGLTGRKLVAPLSGYANGRGHARRPICIGRRTAPGHAAPLAHLGPVRRGSSHKRRPDRDPPPSPERRLTRQPLPKWPLIGAAPGPGCPGISQKSKNHLNLTGPPAMLPPPGTTTLSGGRAGPTGPLTQRHP